jgi:hypothetical protein
VGQKGKHPRSASKPGEARRIPLKRMKIVSALDDDYEPICVLHLRPLREQMLANVGASRVPKWLPI